MNKYKNSDQTSSVYPKIVLLSILIFYFPFLSDIMQTV